MNENSLKKGCYDYLKEALEKISYDKYNKKYMTHSKIEAYNFDNLKQVYTKKIHHSENGICSVDAIWMIGDKPVFIEFKNGNNFTATQLKNKIRDSLLIFCDLTGSTISETRTNSECVVVYNKSKKPVKENESIQCLIDNRVVESDSRDYIKKILLKKGKLEFIRWGLANYAGIYFEVVHTYDQEEFEVYLKEMDNC